MKDWVNALILGIGCGYLSYHGTTEGWSVICIVVFGFLSLFFLLTSYGSWKYDRPCYTRTDPKTGMSMSVYNCCKPSCRICGD